MRTRRWITTAVVGVVTATTLGASHAASSTQIIGGTPAQRAMARWALGRFAGEGLSLPPLEIRFVTTASICRANLGVYADGVVSVCGTHAAAFTRRILLHEMAHGWADFNLSAEERAQFLEVRRLQTWNDGKVSWSERGYEHAAEIMGWALSDQGTAYLRLRMNNSTEQLTRGYEALTGEPLPKLNK
jgi:hypothetical protein